MDMGTVTPNTPLGQPPPGTVSNFNEPVDQQRYTEIVATLWTLFSFSMLCSLLRLYTRAVVLRQFGWDDFFALLAMLLNVGQAVAWNGEIQTGVSDYDWNVRMLEWLEVDGPYYNLWNGISGIFFYWGYTFIKLSILMLYLRVIGPSRRIFRIYVYVLIFIVIGTAVGATADLLSWCHPAEKLFKPDTPGTCNYTTDLFYARAILSVIADVFILIPPIPIIWKLSYTRARKLGLIFALCMGLTVTAIALSRAILLSPQFTNFHYFLYDEYDATYYSILEVNLALACVSLPALTQLFRVFSTRQRSSGSRGDRANDGTMLEPGQASPSDDSTSRGGSGGRKHKPSSVTRIINGLYSGLGRTQRGGAGDYATSRGSVLAERDSNEDRHTSSQSEERKEAVRVGERAAEKDESLGSSN